MTDKEATNVLIELLKKYPLTDEEQRAVRTAVGILGWTSLAEGRLKARKARQERKTLLD